MSNRCSRRSARTGLTLVEVVAGIALLATLLVSLLSAFRAHAAQIRSAQDRLRAIRIADELLATWMAAGVIPAVDEQESIPETTGWSWRIARAESSPDLQKLGAAAVRLEIVEASEDSSARVLTFVELMVQGNSRTGTR